jgi:hypothetical protein
MFSSVSAVRVGKHPAVPREGSVCKTVLLLMFIVVNYTITQNLLS